MDTSNRLKPPPLPPEEITIKIYDDWEERSVLIAYLQDGLSCIPGYEVLGASWSDEELGDAVIEMAPTRGKHDL